MRLGASCWQLWKEDAALLLAQLFQLHAAAALHVIVRFNYIVAEVLQIERTLPAR
jgi:hypothetical protein